MHNVILFPVVRRLEDRLWHGCRRYRNVGEVKQAVSAKDWKRIYDWDLRRMLREGFSLPSLPRATRHDRFI